MDEKPQLEHVHHDSQSEQVTGQDWPEHIEKSLVRKLDTFVLSLLMLVFFTLQLDRANTGNALTGGLLKDIGISQDQYNTGTQLLYVGIIVLEIPSNLVLFRVGPKIWIGGQCIAWGLVATFQAFQHGVGAWYATRLLLGLCEAGFIPGSLFTLSLFYKNSELSKRFALLFFANGLASASGGLIAFGILRMDGVASLSGWQWLFIIEGILTIFAGVVFLCFFPGTPKRPIPLTRLEYFSSEELDILRRRILLDDPSKASEREHITCREIINALSNWRAWPHFVLTIVGLAPSNALWSYMPTIIASFGYNKLGTNAMSSVAQWISAFLVLFAGYVADKTKRRGLVVLGCVIIYFTFMVTFTAINAKTSASTEYAILTLGAATCSWWHSVNGSWLSLNARTPGERSITMAMFIMSANIAGIVSGFLFRSDDKPHYYRGWDIIAAFVSLALLLVIYLNVQYALINKKLAKSKMVGRIEGYIMESSKFEVVESLGNKDHYNF